VRRAAEGFRIERSDSTVVISYPNRQLTLFTDRRKKKMRADGDAKIEYRAWWEGGRLWIERKLDGDITVTEEYYVQSGTGRLHVLTRLEGDRFPTTIAFMRVYDSATEDSEDEVPGHL
jgi:hypothetical protein